MTLKKVLIANRGEIAVRIIRAAKEAGISTVAVYADEDIDALHVRLADEAYGLKGATATETYLDKAKLLEIAVRAKVDSVHPGYGFLSERADFAAAVQSAGLIWIGPNPETIEILGDKARARSLAADVGAPLVPGTQGSVANVDEVVDFAEKFGLPIAIKAVAGGGGRGIRVVREFEHIHEAFDAAVREATQAFGRGDCLVERFLDRPRHIEAQILGDSHGRIAVLGTRDCSLQRRNQKLVEEAPAPFLPEDLRERIHQAASDICKAVGYIGAGTVEFLLGEDGTLSFLEVNTRLQVEHPVTELVTGVDLVHEQFVIASGKPMTVPETVELKGHALEFRINAEDPALGYLPTPGEITRFDVPGGQGVRVDSGVVANSVVSGNFDSLLAKLIVWGKDREQAFARAQLALEEFQIEGVATVLPFHRYVINDPAFVAENSIFEVHTRWIEEVCEADFAAAPGGREPHAQHLTRLPIEIDGKLMEVGLPTAMLASFTSSAGQTGAGFSELAAGDAHSVTASLTGTLASWKVDDGSQVSAGETVAILEAMKMEVPVQAHRAGMLRHELNAGDAVYVGATLGSIE